jgi:hypothetical protein
MRRLVSWLPGGERPGVATVGMLTVICPSRARKPCRGTISNAQASGPYLQQEGEGGFASVAAMQDEQDLQVPPPSVAEQSGIKFTMHTARYQPSKIRLIRARNLSVLSRVPLDVFRTDNFGPWAYVGPISDGRRPGRGEHAVILDRKVEL